MFGDLLSETCESHLSVRMNLSCYCDHS